MRPLFPGGPAPSQAQGDTRRNTTLAAAGLPALESAPAVTAAAVSQSALAWMLRERGADLHGSGVPGGRRVLAALCPPSCASACPGGEHRILAVPLPHLILFYLILFRLPTLQEAKTLLSVAFQLFSL